MPEKCLQISTEPTKKIQTLSHQLDCVINNKCNATTLSNVFYIFAYIQRRRPNVVHYTTHTRISIHCCIELELHQIHNICHFSASQHVCVCVCCASHNCNFQMHASGGRGAMPHDPHDTIRKCLIVGSNARTWCNGDDLAAFDDRQRT